MKRETTSGYEAGPGLSLDAAELPATNEIREQKSPAAEAMSVFTAGMPAT